MSWKQFCLIVKTASKVSLLVIVLCCISCERSGSAVDESDVLLFGDREMEWTPEQYRFALQSAVSRLSDGFLPADLSIVDEETSEAGSSTEARQIYEEKIDELFEKDEVFNQFDSYFRKLLMVDSDETFFQTTRRVGLALYILRNRLSQNELFLIEGSISEDNPNEIVAYDAGDYTLNLTPPSEQVGILSDPFLVRDLQTSGTGIPAIRSYMQYLSCQSAPFTVPDLNQWESESLATVFQAEQSCESCHVYLELMQGAISNYNTLGYDANIAGTGTWGKLSDTEPVLIAGNPVALNDREQHYVLFEGGEPILSLREFVEEFLAKASDTVDECWSRRAASIVLEIDEETAGQGFKEVYAFNASPSEEAYLDRFIELYREKERVWLDTIQECLKLDWCFIGPALEPILEEES